jgi:hypothetical protein
LDGKWAILTEVYRDFPECFQTNGEIVRSSKSCSVNHSSISPPFDATPYRPRTDSVVNETTKSTIGPDADDDDDGGGGGDDDDDYIS